MPSAIRLARSSAPPEKVLKMSRTPPRVFCTAPAKAVGSMPGIGTKLRNRNTINAPSVNHKRFLRSVALLNFARLRLDASWSALDAMVAALQITLAEASSPGAESLIP